MIYNRKSWFGFLVEGIGEDYVECCVEGREEGNCQWEIHRRSMLIFCWSSR